MFLNEEIYDPPSVRQSTSTTLFHVAQSAGLQTAADLSASPYTSALGGSRNLLLWMRAWLRLPVPLRMRGYHGDGVAL